MAGIVPIRSGITLERHHVAAKDLIALAEQQALALETTLRLINGAFNDRELNPNEDSPFNSHYPDEVNNSIGRVRDVRVDLDNFWARIKGKV